MLYFNFNNDDPRYCNGYYEGYSAFKFHFGIQEHGNGVKSRKNRILLNYLKDRNLLHRCVESGDYSMLWINNMADLKKKLTERIMDEGAHLPYTVQLINNTFHSGVYETDNRMGLCEDGDLSCIREFNHEQNKVFKMKAGRFFRKIVEETETGRNLSEGTKVWYCGEEFTRDWSSFSFGSLPETKLHVNDNFERIYDSYHLKGDFHSCMVDKGYHTMYEDAVSAKAAYLTDGDNKIIARCVIFTDVTDQDGKTWRLAERQYSSDLNLMFQRALIEKLIAGDYIDGYKQVGAGCCDSRAFVDIYGNSLSEKRFSIDCELSRYDTVSYMDSFKWYDKCKGKAYNYDDCSWDYELDFTEGSIERYENGDDDDDDDENYDEYHEEWTYSDLVTVHVHGQSMTCNENALDDFIYISGEGWTHEDDVYTCPECGNRFVKANGVESELTEETYCDSNCLEQAEQKHREQQKAERQAA